jgi:hypothetical protein
MPPRGPAPKIASNTSLMSPEELLMASNTSASTASRASASPRSVRYSSSLLFAAPQSSAGDRLPPGRASRSFAYSVHNTPTLAVAQGSPRVGNRGLEATTALPRDPLASADFGMDRAAPHPLATRLEPSPARRILQCGRTSRQFEEPICGDPPAGLVHRGVRNPDPGHLPYPRLHPACSQAACQGVALHAAMMEVRKSAATRPSSTAW